MSPRQLVLGIDASRSARPHPTGVERYSTEIIRALLKEWTGGIRLYTPAWIPAFPRPLQRRLRCPRLWTLLRLSLEMLLHKPDLLFVPAHVLPFFAPKRSFVTIHDIAYEKIPEAYSKSQRRYLRWSTRRALRHCERVIVPSEAVRDDLVRLYGAEPERIVVIPHGPLALAPCKKPRASEEPFFLYVGRLEKKKNLELLLDAWELVQKKYSNVRLVLAGTPCFGSEDLLLRAQTLPKVDLPGFVDEARVSELFHTATAFVFPSKEEGFGFPILQAFSAGCPVICSDLPVLREVAGDAAIYVDVNDAKGLARHMLQLLENPESGSVLTLKGKKRLEGFSWERAGKHLMQYLTP